ncbi:uncharacterized protein B0H18DRAFT_1008622 [Fomitopsis serialis]|uniref:uncharacterized protein n=1 Tax=Fomitopsis serialis TaxID=139415 RepID=UPI002008DA92|nr:uncharacterized protein B0H18DRAFT_1008622 [Neoantrodia serialis]KAH9925836.1 hypothetical protein B0H18DRAFT_1008622 [Neoantrodia serialis]
MLARAISRILLRNQSHFVAKIASPSRLSVMTCHPTSRSPTVPSGVRTCSRSTTRVPGGRRVS